MLFALLEQLLVRAVLADLVARYVVVVADLVAVVADGTGTAGAIGTLVGLVDRENTIVAIDDHKGLLVAVDQRLQLDSAGDFSLVQQHVHSPKCRPETCQIDDNFVTTNHDWSYFDLTKVS